MRLVRTRSLARDSLPILCVVFDDLKRKAKTVFKQSQGACRRFSDAFAVPFPRPLFSSTSTRTRTRRPRTLHPCRPSARRTRRPRWRGPVRWLRCWSSTYRPAGATTFVYGSVIVTMIRAIFPTKRSSAFRHIFSQRLLFYYS